MKSFLTFVLIFLSAGFAFAQNVVILEGEITENTTLTADNRYLLRGGVFIGNDQDETILTVEPGTFIYGEQATDGMLVIRRGSKIIADGTRDNPIVFTSDQEEGQQARADWGGIIINGRAPLNVEGGVAEGEGGTGLYGGGENPDPHDNSGILRYVRVEFAGREISADNELNGIAFQAVGDGTVVDYIQVHMNKDDGVEFFGGTVNAKHVYITGAADDQFDWTDGWQGKGQFWICQHYWDDCDQGIEADNNGEDNDAEPRSNPQIYNLTLVGAKNLRNGESDIGMLLREGTGVTIKNAIALNFGDAGIDIDHEATFNNAVDGEGNLNGNLIVDNSIIYDNNMPFKGVEEDDGEQNFPFTVEEFMKEMNMHNRRLDPQLMDPYNYYMPDFRPRGGAPVFQHYAQPPDDGFFEQVDYIGGMGPDDNWIEGWTIAAPQPEEPEPVIVEGELTGEITWTSDNYYLLRGGVFIGNDQEESILHIEQGTMIFGEQATDGMLVIRRHSKIMAVGSPYAPIVFTSDQEEGQQARADWGGIILNGLSHLNVEGGVAEGEGGTGLYGGGENPDPHDNSGTLKYVRVEYAGREISADNELNGIALQACGDGTVIDYVQVHMNKDDGIEFFGGTVNAKHVYITGAADDQFDWTDGWQGKGQFWVCQQYPDDCDQGIEADNNGEDNDAEPRSHPMLYNLTLIGAKNDQNDESDIGMLLREGTGAVIKNAIVINFGDAGIDIDHEATFVNAWGGNALNGNLVVDNSIFYDNAATWEGVEEGEENFPFNVEQFVSDLNMHNRVVDPMLENPYNTEFPHYRPTDGSPARMHYAEVPDDPFFDDVDFIGGVDPDYSWLVGWTTPGTYALDVEEDVAPEVPREFVMSEVYPNPFNPSANINFQVPWNADVSLNVFDLNGRLVDVVEMNNVVSGAHTIAWSGMNAATGMYVFVLEANGQMITAKGMLIK